MKTQPRYWYKTIGPTCDIILLNVWGLRQTPRPQWCFHPPPTMQHTPWSAPQNTSYFGVWLIWEIPSTLSLKRMNNFHSISELWALMNGGFAKDEKFNSLSLKAHYVSLSDMTQSLHMLLGLVWSLSLATSCMKARDYRRHDLKIIFRLRTFEMAVNNSMFVR